MSNSIISFHDFGLSLPMNIRLIANIKASFVKSELLAKYCSQNCRSVIDNLLKDFLSIGCVEYDLNLSNLLIVILYCIALSESIYV